MYRYTVSAEFANQATAAEWLHWLKEEHVQAVLDCGATSAEIIRLDEPVTAYEIRYVFPDREAYLHYRDEHAPRLQAEGLERFPETSGVQYERSTGLIEATFPK
ncbi:MAG: DUF4286 domain-containing protein [Phycisphaerae bacterium]|nr:DUF4286 domain-containing protein [Phycisphaerae bacterium]|tara:strand:+ start:715 stop:1026 length:312 start_codon:yes stop_codon:yes gene_type:complete